MTLGMVVGLGSEALVKDEDRGDAGFQSGWVDVGVRLGMRLGVWVVCVGGENLGGWGGGLGGCS